MIKWTDADISRAVGIAEGAGCGLVYAADFVPIGCDRGEAVSVLYRGFTPEELAEWIDAPSGLLANKNACMRLVISVDGKWGSEIPGAVAWLADLADDALSRIIYDASEHLGLYEIGQAETVRVKATSRNEELAPFDLDATIAGQLLAKYRDPGQLMAVRIGQAPPLVLRRPTADDMQAMRGKGTHAAGCDLLVTCIVRPAAIEERRTIVERLPGLGTSLMPHLAAMRKLGATTEKKGMRTYGRAVGP